MDDFSNKDGWGIPQIIPSATCFSCDVCCRFPEKDSFLAPFFTDEEVETAIAHGMDKEYFRKRPGDRATQVDLIPEGEGYICPAFSPQTQECRIYPVRPLECRLYPFVVMKGKNGTEILLGVDLKCPFFDEQEGKRDIRHAVHGLVSRLEGEAFVELFQRYPELVGRFQEDVRVLQKLPRLSSTLLYPGSGSLFEYVKPFGIEDLPLLKGYLDDTPCPLSSWTPSAIFLWEDFFRYYWGVFEGCLCLFAEDGGYLYMPLPPLGKNSRREAVIEALLFMERVNGGARVSRIENIPEAYLSLYRDLELRIHENPHEYVYDREILVALQGDRFKSKRADYNFFIRHYPYTLETMSRAYSTECIGLFRDWKRQKEQKYKDGFHYGLLQDADRMHRKAFDLWDRLGLEGIVVCLDGRVKAYTYGVPLNQGGFCILAEVRDPYLKGISAFIFREFCRSLEEYSWINTMDDSGLENLRAAKASYRPVRRLPSFTARVKD